VADTFQANMRCEKTYPSLEEMVKDASAKMSMNRVPSFSSATLEQFAWKAMGFIFQIETLQLASSCYRFGSGWTR